MIRADSTGNAVPAEPTKGFPADPDYPFPVGVEYYRAPVPPREFWDEDFARIRAAGMRIIRSFTFWNWTEPAPGKFEFDDMDDFLAMAAKHDLKVWLDIPAATHGTCPEWMLRQHPDMRVVWHDGTVQQSTAAGFAPQGVMVHNFDHPMWREYAERYVTAIVTRYKDHPNMLVWGTCDGVNLSAAWADSRGYPPYNDYTIAKYIRWLKERFTLDQLNERLLRRYRSWDDVDPPRNNAALVEMTLYRRFHYENVADMLGWMADLIDRLDGRHEQRSHGGAFPQPWEEMAAKKVDGWGLSFPSSDLLTSDDPYQIATRYFGFDWSRAIGKNGRWWTEEIYAGFRGYLNAPGSKQSTPEEQTSLLWLSLVAGAAGALYWQYRPEYMSFEAPGLNLAALDGTPNRRFRAIEEAISQIDLIKDHLPLEIPAARVALAYSGPSQELFIYDDQKRRFQNAHIGLFRTLWAANVPVDIATPSMDWSRYKVVILPHFAVLDDVAIERIRDVLENAPDTHIIATGHLGTFCAKGHWSFHPPEGLADLVPVRLDDFQGISPKDIREGRNVLVTEQGEFPLTHVTRYAILEPQGDAEPFATLNGDVVAVRTQKLTWWGLSLCEGFGDIAPPSLILPMLKAEAVASPFTLSGDPILAFRRRSKLGGSLVFFFNIQPTLARTQVEFNWPVESVTDLIEQEELRAAPGTFQIELPPGTVRVLHLPDPHLTLRSGGGT